MTNRANIKTTDYQYKYNDFRVKDFEKVFCEETERSSEWQDELDLNMYAMDMRMYDPAIARWVVHDPIVHHTMSPYNAFDGNPVFWADPSGGEVISSEDHEWNQKFENSIFNGNNGADAFSLFNGNFWLPISNDKGNENNSNVNKGEVSNGGPKNGDPDVGDLRFDNSEGENVDCCPDWMIKLYKGTLDHGVSPIMEGGQVFYVLIKGFVYDLPSEMIRTGSAEHIRIDGDLKIASFENGKFVIKTYSSYDMTPKEKREVFVKPAMSIMLAPASITGNFWKDLGITTGTTEVVNFMIDQIEDN